MADETEPKFTLEIREEDAEDGFGGTHTIYFAAVMVDGKWAGSRVGHTKAVAVNAAKKLADEIRNPTPVETIEL